MNTDETHTLNLAIVAEARRWLGTPYCHQASIAGLGTDCIGLLRGVWRAVYGEEPELPPGYTRDWAEASGDEPLLAAAHRHLIEIAASTAGPGDVLFFRWRNGFAAKHVAILSSSSTIIHAVEGAVVAEVTFTAWWRRRTAAAFAFPGTR